MPLQQGGEKKEGGKPNEGTERKREEAKKRKRGTAYCATQRTKGGTNGGGRSVGCAMLYSTAVDVEPLVCVCVSSRPSLPPSLPTPPFLPFPRCILLVVFLLSFFSSFFSHRTSSFVRSFSLSPSLSQSVTSLLRRRRSCVRPFPFLRRSLIIHDCPELRGDREREGKREEWIVPLSLSTSPLFFHSFARLLGEREKESWKTPQGIENGGRKASR